MRVGVIGHTSVVHDFLEALNELKKEKNVECTAILALRSKDIEPSQSLADEFQISRLRTDRECFFSDPNIDAVYIALPNAFHYEYSMDALEHGKHVFCEKPFVPNVWQADRLIEAAKKNHVMIFEMITTLYFPNYLSLRERLPEIGDVIMAECNFSHVSGKYNDLINGKNPNVFNLDMCAGTMADMGIYAIHFVLGLFGRPEKAQYFANLYKTGIDTAGMLVMQWPDRSAVCISSKNSRGRNALIIQGSKGYIVCDCGANLITGYTIWKGKEKEFVNVQENKPRLYYELAAFEEIIQNQDYNKCYQILDYTKMVVSVCEFSRRAAGIIYPTDRRDN